MHLWFNSDYNRLSLIRWSNELEPPSMPVESYWNKFLKVIFLPKNYFLFALCTIISVISYFIFHHQTISSWFKKFYPGVMSHLNWLPVVLNTIYIITIAGRGLQTYGLSSIPSVLEDRYRATITGRGLQTYGLSSIPSVLEDRYRATIAGRGLQTYGLSSMPTVLEDRYRATSTGRGLQTYGLFLSTYGLGGSLSCHHCR